MEKNNNGKALVIDEIAENVRVLTEDLQSGGFEVISAANGLDGISLAKSEAPDIILLDLMMPDIDGFKICKILKDEHLTADIPIILISARDDTDDIIKGLDLGAVDYISKPFHFPIVAARVRAAVRLKHSKDEIKKINQSLEIARNEAQSSEKAKMLFLANMSHEIRTPLSGVLGMSSLLIETKLSEEQKIFVDTITSSGTLLMELINNVLDYSKFESKKISLEGISFNLSEMIEGIFNIVRHNLHDKPLRLIKKIDQRITNNLVGDPTRLRQILLNLMSNAVKFSRDGDIVVNVNLLKQSNDSCQLRFEVVDSGTGIDSEKIQYLFQPFSQADESTTRLFGGTGLGLAICKETIELMDGEIGVDSIKNEGSSFWFEIELPISLRTDNTSSSTDLLAIDNMLQGKHILLVEDDKTNQLFATALLNKTGADITVADNGQIALDNLSKSDFDIVLMDCQMPVMDGFETTRTIRNGETRNKEIAIIAMTANAMAGDKEGCIEAGMNDYLSKPFNKEEFFNMLHKWIID